MDRGRLLVLSGDDRLILQTLQQSFGSPEWSVVSVDEKQIGNPVQLVRILRREKAQVLAFGCKDLALQRYQFWLSAFLCLGGASRKLIVDEAGVTKKVGILRFVFVDLPRFCTELIMSLWIIVRTLGRLAVTNQSSSVRSSHD